MKIFANAEVLVHRLNRHLENNGKAMDYESWKASSDVLKPLNIHIYFFLSLFLSLSLSVALRPNAGHGLLILKVS